MYTCCQHVSDISQQSRAHFERKNLDNMEPCVLCRERQICTMKAHRTASNSVPLGRSFDTEWTEVRCQTVIVLNVGGGASAQSEKNSCLFLSWRQPKEVWDQLFLHSGICSLQLSRTHTTSYKTSQVRWNLSWSTGSSPNLELEGANSSRKCTDQIFIYLLIYIFRQKLCNLSKFTCNYN